MLTSYGYYLYCSVLFLALVCGIVRYKILDGPSKIFMMYISFSVISEYISYFVGKYLHNNMPVYAIYGLVEFGFISLYFNNVIDVFRRYNIGLYIGGVGILVGIANIIFLQGLYVMNSYFLVFEDIATIAMSLFFFFRLLLHHEQLRLVRYHHFWFAVIMVFFWSVTFLNWSLYDYFVAKYYSKMWIISNALFIVDIITYLGISTVFILYPAMQKSDG